MYLIRNEDTTETRDLYNNLRSHITSGKQLSDLLSDSSMKEAYVRYIKMLSPYKGERDVIEAYVPYNLFFINLQRYVNCMDIVVLGHGIDPSVQKKLYELAGCGVLNTLTNITHISGSPLVFSGDHWTTGMLTKIDFVLDNDIFSLLCNHIQGGELEYTIELGSNSMNQNFSVEELGTYLFGKENIFRYRE